MIINYFVSYVRTTNVVRFSHFKSVFVESIKNQFLARHKVDEHVDKIIKTRNKNSSYKFFQEPRIIITLTLKKCMIYSAYTYLYKCKDSGTMDFIGR